MDQSEGQGQATRPRIALALASGAPGGAIYEIGALRAIDEAFDGIDLNQLYFYVGVSAGAFLCACLVNDITPAQMCRAIVSPEPGEHPFVPETFFTPAAGNLWRSARRLPGLLAEALWDYASRRRGRSLLLSLTRLSRALPIGIFDNEPIHAYLEKIFNLKGRSNDFRRLGKPLVVVASDLDSGRAVRFGAPGMDHVPISRAIQASGALPGLYEPVEIDGRHYVDGVLHKTLHASVPLEAGAELVICVNPIVPVDTVHAAEAGLMSRGKLLDRGLPTVLSQAVRTLIHSRMEVGMAAYRAKFEQADVVLLQPQRDDYLMFFTNIFGFADRVAVCEHAYRSTRRYLLSRYDDLAPVLARHGVTLRRDVLEDASRDLWQGVGIRSSDLPAGRTTLAATPPQRAASSGSAMVRRLDGTLIRLERLLDGAPPGPLPDPPPGPLPGETEQVLLDPVVQPPGG